MSTASLEPEGETPRSRWQRNPFLILGVSPSAFRSEVERTGQTGLKPMADPGALG